MGVNCNIRSIFRVHTSAVGVQGSCEGPNKRSISAGLGDDVLMPVTFTIATSFKSTTSEATCGGFKGSKRAFAVSTHP